MRVLFVGSCAKEPDRPEANEDAYAFSPDGQRLAVSDGASESYDSRLWAQLLAIKFAADPCFGDDWLRSAASVYLAEHKFESMSWSQQLAFERGCFATLLAAEHDLVANRLILFGIGDSVAVLFDGASIARSWPLDEPERFLERPTLLSTRGEHNEFARDVGFDVRQRLSIDLSGFSDPVLLCMTDALGEWTLRMSREQPEQLVALLMVRSEEELAELVIAERTAKRMRVDDSTLAILKFDAAEDGNGLPQP
jgi:hypothetical protein